MYWKPQSQGNKTARTGGHVLRIEAQEIIAVYGRTCVFIVTVDAGGAGPFWVNDRIDSSMSHCDIFITTAHLITYYYANNSLASPRDAYVCCWLSYYGMLLKKFIHRLTRSREVIP